ncbi:MAG: Dihydrolipoyl dehydrogenase [Candidatus Heimdallarchaeota archaeon LC_2]|nr:MAG: Dihydrolipoyl dehydrogenase [Candidatus Heimdallarchaeota archaeon LC_2]
MSEKFDVVIIGAGPGGYPAAIRASQLGKTVAIIDKGTIGGECLNWGCIPSKAMISASDFYYKAKTESSQMGISIDNISVDLPKLKAWKQSIQDRLIGGIKQLLKTNKVKTYLGTAKVLNRNQVSVDLNEGGNLTIDFDSLIVATGTEFISIPGFDIDETFILSSKGLFDLDHLPDELICIGGGIIGIELGTVFAKLGSKVKVVELLPQLLTGIDKRIVRYVEKKLKKLEVDVFLESKGKSYSIKNGKINLTIETKDGEQVITGNKILLSIGKKASTEGLNLVAAGIKLDKRGFIIVDKQQRTNVSNIYAIGDCTGLPFLAHKATKQGIIAAEVISGKNSISDFKSMPSAIFTDPEIAIAGITEAEAKEKGMDVMVGQAAFAASGRAMSILEEDGFVRIISDANDGVLLGVEIVGPHATDLISEAALALEMGATVEDVGFTVHPHPTLPEMIMEAAEAIEGKAIHIPNARKRKKK